MVQDAMDEANIKGVPNHELYLALGQCLRDGDAVVGDVHEAEELRQVEEALAAEGPMASISATRPRQAWDDVLHGRRATMITGRLVNEARSDVPEPVVALHAQLPSLLQDRVRHFAQIRQQDIACGVGMFLAGPGVQLFFKCYTLSSCQAI